MNEKFPSKPTFEICGYKQDSALLVLLRPFRYVSSAGTITVPVDFITDGASVPRIFWNILSPYGSYFPAALIHDFLYSKASDSYGFTRLQCDQIFKAAMYDIGIGWLKRETIYRAVRAAGWLSYKQK